MFQRDMIRPMRAVMVAALALVAGVLFGVEAASASKAAPVGELAPEQAVAQGDHAPGEFEETAGRVPPKPARKLTTPTPKLPSGAVAAQSQAPKKITIHRR